MLTNIDKTVDSAPFANGCLQIVEKTPVDHELGDNVNGLAASTQRVELNELRMKQLLHEVCLGTKVLGVHAFFERLDGHLHAVHHVLALPHVAELPLTDLAHESELRTIDLVGFHERVSETLGDRCDLETSRVELNRQTVRAYRVVSD